jgi:hypothetical protein
MNFTHVHVVDVFPLELTVYPPNELRNRPRSSTDGKPIVRIRDTMLRKLCEAEHPELYRRYVESGEVPSLDDILAAEEKEDDGDSLLDLASVDDDDPSWHEELVDPWCETGPDEPLAASETEDEPDDDDHEPRIRRVGEGRRRGRYGADDG